MNMNVNVNVDVDAQVYGAEWKGQAVAVKQMKMLSSSSPELNRCRPPPSAWPPALPMRAPVAPLPALCRRYVRRFLEEATLMAGLRHPHVVRVLVLY